MLKPNARAYIFRTAMIGGGLSYKVYVPVSHVQNYDGTRYTTIINDGQPFLDYTDATMPELHYSMEKGHERYEHYLAHEKQAKKEAMVLARKAFPELRLYDGDPFLLWVCGLPVEETSAKVILRIP